MIYESQRQSFNSINQHFPNCWSIVLVNTRYSRLSSRKRFHIFHLGPVRMHVHGFPPIKAILLKTFFYGLVTRTLSHITNNGEGVTFDSYTCHNLVCKLWFFLECFKSTDETHGIHDVDAIRIEFWDWSPNSIIHLSHPWKPVNWILASQNPFRYIFGNGTTMSRM